MREKPQPNYNVGKDLQTGEIIRTDKAQRLRQATGLMTKMLASTERGSFDTSYLAYHLNLEDDEVPEFMTDIPGVSYFNDIYTVNDKEALTDYLEQAV